MYRTPQRTNKRSPYPASPFTPPEYTSLSSELKQVLQERNLLTAKSRKKGNIIFDDLIVKHHPVNWCLFSK